VGITSSGIFSCPYGFGKNRELSPIFRSLFFYFFPKTAANGLLNGTFSSRGLIRWGRAWSGRSWGGRLRDGPPGAEFPEAPSPGARFSPGFPPCAEPSSGVFFPRVFSRLASAAALPCPPAGPFSEAAPSAGPGTPRRLPGRRGDRIDFLQTRYHY